MPVTQEQFGSIPARCSRCIFRYSCMLLIMSSKCRDCWRIAWLLSIAAEQRLRNTLSVQSSTSLNAFNETKLGIRSARSSFARRNSFCSVSSATCLRKASNSNTGPPSHEESIQASSSSERARTKPFGRPFGRWTGKPNIRAQRCTVRTPLPRY